MPVKVTPKGDGFGAKPAGKPASVHGHQPERHDDRRVAGPRRQCRARAARGRAARRACAASARHRCRWAPSSRTSLARSACIAPCRPCKSISSELSSCTWPYLSVPIDSRARFHARRSVSVFTGARRAERPQPRVEVALHAVLEDDGAVLVPSLAVAGTAADAPRQQVLRSGSRRHNRRNVGRVHDRRALAAARPPSPRHHRALRVVQAARGAANPRGLPPRRRRRRAGCRCARPSDRRAAGTACSRCAAAAGRRASPGRWGRAPRPSSTPSTQRGVGDGPGHRARRVLVGGDGDDAVAADAARPWA